MAERKVVSKSIGVASFDYESLGSVKKQIEDLIGRYGEDAYFDISIRSSYGDEYIECTLNYKELETQAEADERVVREKQLYENARQYKLKQLENLKKELGVE